MTTENDATAAIAEIDRIVKSSLRHFEAGRKQAALDILIDSFITYPGEIVFPLRAAAITSSLHLDHNERIIQIRQCLQLMRNCDPSRNIYPLNPNIYAAKFSNLVEYCADVDNSSLAADIARIGLAYFPGTRKLKRAIAPKTEEATYTAVTTPPRQFKVVPVKRRHVTGPHAAKQAAASPPRA